MYFRSRFHKDRMPIFGNYLRYPLDDCCYAA
jgi:hypothetical protein